MRYLGKILGWFFFSKTIRDISDSMALSDDIWTIDDHLDGWMVTHPNNRVTVQLNSSDIGSLPTVTIDGEKYKDLSRFEAALLLKSMAVLAERTKTRLLGNLAKELCQGIEREAQL